MFPETDSWKTKYRFPQGKSKQYIFYVYLHLNPETLQILWLGFLSTDQPFFELLLAMLHYNQNRTK